MKIWTVTFNDGGWHTSRPEYQVVAESKEGAIEQILNRYPHYRNGFDTWASEFKIDGYVIEVYDEKSYNRDKNINKIIDSSTKD